MGWELERALPSLGEVVPTGRDTLDLTSADAIRRAMRDAKPDVIVNAAAYTAVDQAEAEPALAMQINGLAPGVLAEEARRGGALLVHYSTDYIFDGAKRSPYLETDTPAPLNAYGRSKLAGDQAVIGAGCRHLILRSSWIYAPRGRNFFLTIARKAKAGEPLRVVADQEGVPTESRFLSELTVRLLGLGTEGLFNAVPSGSTTWHAFAQAIVEQLGVAVPVEAIASAEYRSPAQRPAYSVLSNQRISSVIGPLPSWQSLLERCTAAWRASTGC